MLNPQSAIRNPQWPRDRRAAFTLLEIMVAVGVLVLLGAALVGLMTAAVEAWRTGEASRQAQEKLQTLKRQLADDFAAALLDAPPVPDFHYALDTLWDLPTDSKDPYYIIYSGATAMAEQSSPSRAARYFAPASGNSTVIVELRIRVPFVVGAALLSARLDVTDKDADAQLAVGRNNPTAADPNIPATWQTIEWLNETHSRDGAIGGAETDVSPAAQGGDIVFVRATLHSSSPDTALFLFGDKFRSEGRPVLILDCYRDPKALPVRPRPAFRAWFEGGTQILCFTRTIPGETEKAALRDAGAGGNTEFLNFFDDNGDGKVDEPANLMALGGRAQVVYRFEPYPASLGKPGLGVLRRGFEAPIGRPAELVPTHEFIPNVAHFGVSFWGGDTTTWEPNPELDPKFDKDNPPHPASQRWISSRYMPEQVQVTVVVEPDGGHRVTTALAKPLPATFPTGDAEADRLLLVQSTRGFYNVQRSADTARTFLRDPRHYIKIGDEWLFYERVASPTAFLIPKAGGRGQRGSVARDPPEGAEVLRGTTSVFTVTIPAFRHWQR